MNLQQVSKHFGRMLVGEKKLHRCKAVAPGRGKAVEINALWYNALRLTEEWLRADQGDAAADPWAERAMQIVVRSLDALPAYARELVDLLVEDARQACAP